MDNNKVSSFFATQCRVCRYYRYVFALLSCIHVLQHLVLHFYGYYNEFYCKRVRLTTCSINCVLT